MCRLAIFAILFVHAPVVFSEKLPEAKADAVAVTLYGPFQNNAAFPDELGEQIFYHPVDRGLELKIAQKLDRLRGPDK